MGDPVELSKDKSNLSQDLMVGLIYPAVLGTIFYTTLREVADQVILAYHVCFSHTAFSFDLILIIKFVLAFLACGFYLCDYLYIMMTNDYSPFFFVCDVCFVFAMYGAFAAVRLDEDGMMPNPKLILAMYCFFLILYYCWDLWELGRSRDCAEFEFYSGIIRWELLSALLVLICFCVIFRFDTVGMFVTEASWVPSAIVAIVMSGVTLGFSYYVYRKKDISSRYASKPQPVQARGA